MATTLGTVIKQRKTFITINEATEYKRCRVQVNRKGVVLRDVVKGSSINTKKQQLCKEGDFLVAEIDAKVGGYGFVGKELEGAIVSSHYFLFEIDETKLVKTYLSWLIQTDIIQDQITSKGSTNYAAIRPHHVLEFEIPLPHIEAQEEIVSKLNTVHSKYLALNEELTQQQSHLRLLRQTVLQEAVQGKLTKQDPTEEPATELLKRIKKEKEKRVKEGKSKKEKELPPIGDDEIPFALPEGWAWCRLQNLCNYIVDCPHSTPKFQSDGFNCIDTTSMDQGEILFSRIRKVSEATFHTRNARLIPEPNDIVFSREGTVGMAVLLPNMFPVCLGQRVMLFRTSSLVIPEYFRYAIISPMFVRQWESGHKGAASKHINIGDLRTYLIPLPPLPEQQRIVAKVQQLQQQIQELETQVQQSRAYAQQLLQSVLMEAFAGNINTYATNELEASLVAEDSH